MKKYKRFKEAKQVGVLYHVTSIKNMLAILKTNQLQGAINGISTSRNKYGFKDLRIMAGSQVQLVLNGDKISNNYKIYPYQDLTLNIYNDEQEEVINTRIVKNIKKYIIKIQLLYSDYWNLPEKEIYIINRLMGKDIDEEFSKDILINFLQEKNIKVEIIK